MSWPLTARDRTLNTSPFIWTFKNERITIIYKAMGLLTPCMHIEAISFFVCGIFIRCDLL